MLPRCNDFGPCGGCATQDLPYLQQLAHKQRLLSELLQSVPCPIAPILPCAEPWRYRNKMEFAFGHNAQGELIIGLRRKGSFSDVLDLRDCWLTSEPGNRLLNLTREFFRAKNYPVYVHKTHAGLLRFLIVRQSFTHNKLLLVLVLADAAAILPEDLTAWISHLRQQVPELASVYLSQQSEKSDTAFSVDMRHLWGDTCLEEQFVMHATFAAPAAAGNAKFRISPLAFFQTNTRQAQVLYQTIVDAAALSGTELVLDLFCGTGTIGQLLAPYARWVYGIESIAPAIWDAKQNATLNGLSNPTYIVDKSEAWLKWNGNDIDADVWILDPPRSGLHPKILRKRLPELERRPHKIIYVSCNPKHLPEDLRLLQQWYTVNAIQPIDMFPHTPHLEVVVSLQLRQ